jgi:predicted SprT family Zn-dependent metalloprotease
MSTLNAYQKLLANREAKLARAEALAEELLAQHLPHMCGLGKWTFAWNTRVRALGVCKYGDEEIQLSKEWTLATPWEEVSDTIRHEIAHAIAGYRANHGPEWQEAAILVGAKPEATYKGGIRTRDVHVAKYEMIDTTTGNVVKSYYRKPTAKTYQKLTGMYISGRRVETEGKLVINPVDLIKELNL